MGRTILYLRQHPWQRRTLTLGMSLILGVTLALVIWPLYQQTLVIRNLTSPDPAVRALATRRAAAMGSDSAIMRWRLARCLDDSDDMLFASAARALEYLKLFGPGHSAPEQMDRLTAIQIVAAPDAFVRRAFLEEALTSGRDNQYIRRILAAGVADKDPSVRALSAVLAAHFADESALERLLADDSPLVAGAAALDAGLAGLKGPQDKLLGMIRALLEKSTDTQAVSCAAYATWKLSPGDCSPAIAKKLVTAKDESLRDRLIYVLGLAADAPARVAVGGAFDAAPKDTPVSAAALLAGARMKLPQTAAQVRLVLTTPQRGTVYASQIMAACQAAMMLDLPVRKEAYDLIANYWDSRQETVLIEAVQLLAQQATHDAGQAADAPSREACIKLLSMASIYTPEPAPADDDESPDSAATRMGLATSPTGTIASSSATSQTTSKPTSRPDVVGTPVASAMAAVALWQLKTPACEELLRMAAAVDSTLPGDVIAWRLGRGKRIDDAWRLGMEMVPELNSPLRVWSDNERTGGAMLAALAAGTPQHKADTSRRLTSRLDSLEDKLFVHGAYRCALLILGDKARRDEVYGLLMTSDFPQRRALTALLLAGDLPSADWLLRNPSFGRQAMIDLLIGRGIHEVLAMAAPSLPRLDTAAEPDMKVWQIRILQDAYGIGRGKIPLGNQK